VESSASSSGASSADPYATAWERLAEAIVTTPGGASFNVITRFADAIGAKPHSEFGLTREQAIAHEGRFFEIGYA
jgi:hypothetical protein